MRLEAPGLENRDVHRRDPFEVMFLNAGVKNMTNAPAISAKPENVP